MSAAVRGGGAHRGGLPFLHRREVPHGAHPCRTQAPRRITLPHCRVCSGPTTKSKPIKDASTSVETSSPKERSTETGDERSARKSPSRSRPTGLAAVQRAPFVPVASSSASSPPCSGGRGTASPLRCCEELRESIPLDLLPTADVLERRHRMSSLRSAHFLPTSAAAASRHTPIPASCDRFKLATFPLKSARRPNPRATNTSMRAIILPPPSSEVSPGPPPMIRTTSRRPGTL